MCKSSSPFTSFSAGAERWSILMRHVNITVNPWSNTRWQSRLQSVHAFRCQASEVCEALLEARQMINDPVVKVEAQALAEEFESYSFLICCVTWCRILTVTNKVNKRLTICIHAAGYNSEFNLNCKALPHYIPGNGIL